MNLSILKYLLIGLFRLAKESVHQKATSYSPEIHSRSMLITEKQRFSMNSQKQLSELPKESSEEFHLELDAVLANKNFPDIVQHAAKLLKQRQYYTVGNFFESLSAQQFTELAALADSVVKSFRISNERSTDTDYFTVLSLILLLAEGQPYITEQNAMDAIKALIALVAVEYGYKVGKCKAFRENYSLVIDLNNPGKPIAEYLKD